MNLQKVKIKSKKNIGVQPVYDISVSDVHHYVLNNGIVSHNSGFVYASSIVVAIKKLKLKEDEDGNRITDVRGIRAACKIMKTRYAKPFESVQVKIPYDTGLDPYSGLTELFEKAGVLVKSGNRLKWTDPETNESLTLYRKDWKDDKIEMIMKKFELSTRINNQLTEESDENE